MKMSRRFQKAITVVGSESGVGERAHDMVLYCFELSARNTLLKLNVHIRHLFIQRKIWKNTHQNVSDS